MRYGDDDRESQNVEDQRSSGGFGGGRGMRIPIQIGGPGGMSLTSLLVVGAICLMLGINPLDLLSGGGSIPVGGQGSSGPQQPLSPQDEANGRFVKRVLADTEDVWNKTFQDSGRKYQEPKLVLFRGGIPTACGTGDARMGPFYCPVDQKVYIDLVFFDELKRRFNAPGEFAQAYVVAHEVGHHVQTLLGVSDRVRDAQQRDPRRANEMQVRMELQADCLAGVWANRTNQMKQRLEPGDIESGLRAASAIGDDTLQKQTQGRVVPESFTHGSSAQRVRWFSKGLEAGQMQACDTFGAGAL
jgi:predicted metalloprotease